MHFQEGLSKVYTADWTSNPECIYTRFVVPEYAAGSSIHDTVDTHRLKCQTAPTEHYVIQSALSKNPVLLADFMGYKLATEGTAFKIYILQATNLALYGEYEYVIQGLSYLAMERITSKESELYIKVRLICFHFRAFCYDINTDDRHSWILY